ncbi:Sex-determining fem-1 [Fusarium napiforme]|uniref:Sex-determining fem-1 n=1 Tax=Fusarium napiforme TaxID=42672 RepID=A0A8H5MIH7_9HYPO|nr:Sex-determining fem-1 [Fusarium napiforme]
MGVTTTSYPGEGDWLKHQNMIKYEYLVKDTSLKDLVILLRAHGLHVTKAQLEYRLKSWNLSKNIDKETWQYIDRKIRKRKDEGKESDVIHCGKRLKKLKVTKETNRHRETNIFARFKTPPPSPTNLQLSICTPPALQMSSNWPLSLPWISLQNGKWNITINSAASKGVTLQHKHQADIATSLMMSMLAPAEENRSVTLSKLIAGANNAIPEWYPGEHEETAQNMLAGPSTKSASECFKLMVYMMSNSMLFQDRRHLEFIFSLMGNGTLDTLAEFKKLRNESPTIRAFLEKLFQLAIREVTSVIIIISNCNPLSKPLALIEWLLEVGIDPNCHCHDVFRQSSVLATPIQQAVKAGSIELVQLLLRYRARADIPQCRTNETAFVNLVLESRGSDAGRFRMLNLLFDHKFLSEDEMLRAAIELGDTALMLKMLQLDPDVTSYETVWLHPACRRRQTHSHTYLTDSSALMMAVQAGGIMAEYMLDHLLVRRQPTPEVLADAYIAAAYGGHYKIILRLEELHSSGAICNREGITPLEVAVVGGDPRVCKHLLERYGGASTLLLLAAAELVKIDVLQLLIDYGGNPNCPISQDDFKLYQYLDMDYSGYRLPSSIFNILIHGDIRNIHMEQSILTLIQNGAWLSRGDIAELSRRGFHRCLEAALAVGGSPNDQDGGKRTALQYALDGTWSFSGDGQITRAFRSAELLIETGAKLNGGEVVRAIDLQNKDLIVYLLRHGGTLTDVDGAGKGCLEAEIIARNDPFLQEALEMQEFAIDAGPFCAAIHRQDWDLVGRLFQRAHSPTDCHLLEGTAVGLAAKAGRLDILDRLLARFTHPSVLCSAILPFRFHEGVMTSIEPYHERLGYWRAPKHQNGSILITASPLTLASLGDDTSGFRELLRRGCCMDRVTWHVLANSHRSYDYLQLLTEFGCGLGSPTKYDAELDTALCKAIKMRQNDLAKYLVEVGADVNEFDLSAAARVSPLQCAVKEGNIDMATYLIETGANINAPPAYSKGATALQFAAINGYIGFARHLIQLGARVNARGPSRFGRSALEGAAEHGRLDMLALLIHHGAVTTGQGRQQLITAVAYAQSMAHHTVTEWLKEKCGWDGADQHALQRSDVNEETWMECLMSFCCDEYHDDHVQCTYHYTEEQRKDHIRQCWRCLRVQYRQGYEDGSDNDSIISFSDEDEDIDTEDDEIQNPSAILDLATVISSMVALWFLLGLLALIAGSAANDPCETYLGSSPAGIIRTTMTTRQGTITVTDKIIIPTFAVNITKSNTKLSGVTGTDKTTIQRNNTVGITTTSTITATSTKLATVTASPEAKIATITVTKPNFVSRTETVTKTETDKNTVTTTTYFTTTIGRRPGFTAIRDNMERISSELTETTTSVGLSAKLFSHVISVTCTDNLPIKKTVTTTSFRTQTQRLPKPSTAITIVTIWTTINETEYPPGLTTTVATTVHPTQTALINVTKTITVDGTVTLERWIPQKTHYQACDRNGSNYLSWVPGDNPSDKRMVNELSRQDHEFNPTEIKVSDAIACCNECMKRKYCRVSFWGRHPGAKREAPPSCYVYMTIRREQCMDRAQPLYARYIADKQVSDPSVEPCSAPYTEAVTLARINSAGPRGQENTGL